MALDPTQRLTFKLTLSFTPQIHLSVSYVDDLLAEDVKQVKSTSILVFTWLKFSGRI